MAEPMELDELRTPVKETLVESTEEPRSDVSMHQSSLKVHPHGLSSKKKLANYHHQHRDTDDNGTSGNYLEFDTSIDLGRSETRQEQSVKSVLENMDVNKMFNVTTMETDMDMSNGKENNDHRGRTELSSPAKLETEEGEPSLKKVKLEQQNIPRLENPGSISITKSDSPAAHIQMEETKSSPMKLEGNSSEINRHSSTIGIINSIKTAIDDMDRENTSPMTPSANNFEENTNNIFNNDASIHRLSPIYPKSQGNATSFKDTTDIHDVEKEHENFQAILKRNEELIHEVNTINLKLNEYMSKLENADYKYNKLHIVQEESRKDFEERLNKVNKELQAVSEDKDALMEKRLALKERLTETNDEIKMLNQNQKILQDKYDEAIRSLDNTNEEYHKLENDRNELKSALTTLQEGKTGLEQDLLAYKTQLNEAEDWNSKLQEEKSAMEDQIMNLEKEVNDKKDIILGLEKKIEDTLENQKSTNEDMLAKVERLQETRANLEKEINDIKADYDNYKTESLTNKEKLQKNLDESIEKARSYENELDQLRTELKGVQSEYTALKRSYIDVDDDAQIRNAEVTELNKKLEELEQNKEVLEKNLSQKENDITSLKENLDSQKNSYNKISLELESLHLKHNNIEKEHLAELESLHDSLSQLQAELKNKSDNYNELKTQLDGLKDENMKLQLAKETDITKSTNNKEYQEGYPDEKRVKELNEKIRSLEDKLTLQEQEKNRQLQQLSDDLYVQYSSKHEQKVKMLKKNYEATYKKNVEEITIQNKSYVQEIKQLSSQLEYERKEKQELLKLLEHK
ncbi:Kinetochore protein SLK19 [Nakaseomyces bracarensis]|uniref:Kinetochore protein SLK19 n=1 Tax=Nakaseomyces bracarensis TaxID=273131 RepID=A0ABR4P177_9SACH